MKRIVTVLMALTMVLSMAACGKKKDATFKIGLCNYVDDASLNQICENIQNTLKSCETDDIKFEIIYQNCNADANLMNQIVQNFIAQKVDLMVGIATPVAMTMQGATEDNRIPVVFAAVSDPLATGIVESLEKPGANVTGTSDYLDTAAIFNLIFAADPNADLIGLLYDAGQDASTTAIAQAKDYLNKKGVKFVEHTGTNVSEVILAADAMIADGVDAIFTPSDNTIMQAELSIYEKLAAAKIPHYAGADSFALNGAFLGYGVDYANLGVETAEMIKEILVDKKNPKDVPVRTFDNGTATVNTEICKTIGFDFETIKKAFSPLCTKVQEIKTAESFN
ncbi:MAG: ABC transporter substrate-binding protein [Lachnospiraceae bacterium]|nr:ABC transporter substrate-binding protein [Lachnospiraceae bacterium]